MRLAEPLRGRAFGLRSPEHGDAAFTVHLRSDPEVTRFLHRIPDSVVAQLRWETAALARDDDLPLIIFRTSTGAPVGTAGIYRLDPERRSAEWGRWVISNGSLAAVESVLLVMRLAFDQLSLETLYVRTLADNARALSVHESLGLTRVAEGRMNVDGVEAAYVEHAVTASEAPALQLRLAPLAERVAARLS